MNRLTGRLIATAAWWAWMPACAWIIWAILHYGFGGVGTWEQGWRLTVVHSWWLPGGDLSHATGLFWIWVVIGLIGTMVILSGLAEDLASDGYKDTPQATAADKAASVLAILAGLAAIAAIVPACTAIWDNDKDAGRFYNAATTFHTTKGSPPPSSLTYLLNGARTGSGECVQRGRHDVPSCIRADQLQALNAFEGRTSSYASALTMMQHAASPAPKTDAWESTLTYLYNNQPGKDGVWTSVVDGSGKATPAYGIAEWDGRSNTVKIGCRFNTGKDNRFDRAFAGQRGNSLRNWLAEKYPNLYYDDADVWGYCDGTGPAIVIPVSRQALIGHRTVDVAAGVIVLNGGKHGIEDEYLPTVKPGQLGVPGPVYPISLVAKQRHETQWAAGRKWMERASFGFEPTSDDAQGDNAAEYLLRGPDRRLYYVTPLTPKASKSQAFIAYAIAPADSVNAGHLNRLDVYVLPDGDQRIANLNTLVNRAVDAVRGTDPTFLNTGGKLEEFTPLGGDMWRAFGVRRGLTEFYIDLSIIGRIEPKTVTVTPGVQPKNTAGAPGKPGQPVACTKTPQQMTPAEIADCIAALADQLRRKQTGKA